MRARTVGRTAAMLSALCCSARALPAQSTPFSIDKFWQLQRLESPEISPDGKTIVYTQWIPNKALNRWDAALWQMDANGDHPTQVAAGHGAQWSPDGLKLAYLAEVDGQTQLILRVIKSGTSTQLTHAKEAPEEFRWSPDGKRLAFIRPVADSASTLGLFTHTFVRRELFVVSSDGGEARQVTKGAMEVGTNDAGVASPVSFNWFPDSRNIAFDGNDSPSASIEYLVSAIFFVDIETGGVGRLTSAPGFWHSPVISPDGRWVAYTGFSDNSASYHPEDLYIMSPDGSGTRLLTKELERDPVNVAWAPDNQSVWFTAEDQGSINIFTASVAGGGAKSATNGAHAVVLSALSSRDGGFGVAVRSGHTEPPEIVRFAIKKPADLKPITKVNASLASQTTWGEVEEIHVRSGDASIQGWLLRPIGFQLSHRYPLVVEVHDGPHAMFAAAFDPAAQVLTAAGYLVLRLNPHGSTGFGAGLGGGLAAGFPGAEVEDILTSIRSIADNGSVDTTRIYLDGCGAGGMSALQVLTRVAPIAAATIRCPGGDWVPLTGATPARSFDGPFFSRPFHQDPLVWAENSPVRFASSIRAPTLILAGRCDLDAPFGVGRALNTALLLRRAESELEVFDDECRGTTSRPSNWVRTIEARLAWYGAPAHHS